MGGGCYSCYTCDSRAPVATLPNTWNTDNALLVAAGVTDRFLQLACI